MRTKSVTRRCFSNDTRRSRQAWPASLAMTLAITSGGCFEASPDGRDDAEGSTGGETSEASDSDASESSGPTTSNDGSSAGTSSSTTGTPETSSTSTGVDGTESDTAVERCEPGEPLGCDGDELSQCNDEGTGEHKTPCALGCNEEELRCYDVDPSNGLAEYLDDAVRERALDLGSVATIGTNEGTVTVDGDEVDVTSFLVEGTPQIRVLVVGSLVAQDVTVSGTPALAIVSDGDIQLSGHFSASAVGSTAGPGALTSPTCQGGDQVVNGQNGNTAAGGAGGGGFGSAGAAGGNAIAQGFHASGGSGGSTTGTATLVPLRGGCDAGVVGASLRGAGGGAVQLVSRTAISVQGILSANGTSRSGGGSGGGILLEAPNVSVSGNVVANGGAGAGGGLLPVAGEHGRTDAQPASGGPANDLNLGEGGDGAAGNTAATSGENVNYMSGLSTDLNFAGHGGGGVGRIRVNVPTDGLTNDGVFSPNPTSGPLGVR
jgi:hypothetical protein